MIRLATFALALCLAVSVASAAVRIPGKLMVSNSTLTSSFTYFMDGWSDSIITSPVDFVLGDISPDGIKMTYTTTTTGGNSVYAQFGDIWVSNLDGSGPVSLTAKAGVKGLNCTSTWSPDGSMLAWQHCDPAPGQKPCDSSWQIWVMNSDGSNARQLMPQGYPNETWFPAWSPNGYRILCEDHGLGCITVNLDGTDVQQVPDVNGEDAKWSRDGARLVSTYLEPDTVDGEPGIWRQLRIANADGSDPQVLVEQFVKDSDVNLHIATHSDTLQPADFPWFDSIRALVGPLNVRWSPTGEQVAFVAALPFDPDGLDYRLQEEVWLYDLNTPQLTRLTDDASAQGWISWNGNNTYPTTDKVVTVDNTTVSFASVSRQGLTNVLWDPMAPALPAGNQFAGRCYDVRTTAGISGLVEISMTYHDETVITGSQKTLEVMRYDPGTARWFDITTSRDVVKNTISTQSDVLGYFALVLPIPQGRFTDVPVTGQGPAGISPFWSFWEIEAAYAANMVKGYDASTYRPVEPVTRDQMAVFIARALAGGDEKVPVHGGTPTFEDVPAATWAYNCVEYAVDWGVVKGYDPTHYGPSGVVDRGQMVVFIARALGWVKVTDAMNTAPQVFPDVPAGFWAGTAVQACKDHGVVKGYDDGTYRPGDPVTRDQMAVYLARAFGLMG